VVFNPDGSWSYTTDTVLTVHGRTEPFAHRDQNTLLKIRDAEPNPLARILAARAAAATASPAA
ncbi:FABP family protein, partial [Bradyrhizobium sp. 23AC]